MFFMAQLSAIYLIIHGQEFKVLTGVVEVALLSNSHIGQVLLIKSNSSVEHLWSIRDDTQKDGGKHQNAERLLSNQTFCGGSYWKADTHRKGNTWMANKLRLILARPFLLMRLSSRIVIALIISCATSWLTPPHTYLQKPGYLGIARTAN